jgi:hypothetical protein
MAERLLRATAFAQADPRFRSSAVVADHHRPGLRGTAQTADLLVAATRSIDAVSRNQEQL